VEVEVEGEEGKRIRVVGTVLGERAREMAHGSGVPAPRCEKGAEENWANYQGQGR